LTPDVIPFGHDWGELRRRGIQKDPRVDRKRSGEIESRGRVIWDQDEIAGSVEIEGLGHHAGSEAGVALQGTVIAADDVERVAVSRPPSSSSPLAEKHMCQPSRRWGPTRRREETTLHQKRLNDFSWI
jgi:hypothetical protein